MLLIGVVNLHFASKGLMITGGTVQWCHGTFGNFAAGLEVQLFTNSDPIIWFCFHALRVWGT